MGLSLSLNSRPIQFLPPRGNIITPRLCQKIHSMLSAKLAQNAAIEDQAQDSPFYLTSSDCIPLHDYISRIGSSPYISKQTLIIATQYLCDKQPTDCQPFQINEKTIHKLFATAVLIARKVHEDVPILNCDYAQISGIRAERMNDLEITFLQQRKFQVFIHAQDYADFEKSLMNQPIRQI